MSSGATTHVPDFDRASDHMRTLGGFWSEVAPRADVEAHLRADAPFWAHQRGESFSKARLKPDRRLKDYDSAVYLAAEVPRGRDGLPGRRPAHCRRRGGRLDEVAFAMPDNGLLRERQQRRAWRLVRAVSRLARCSALFSSFETRRPLEGSDPRARRRRLPSS